MNNQIKAAFFSGAGIILFVQLLKLFHIVPYVEAGAICAIVLTVLFSVRYLWIENKEKKKGYWLFIVYLLALEIIIGLDRILPERAYELTVTATLGIGACINFWLDSPSVHEKFDDKEIILKNTSTLLMIALLIELARVMFSSYNLI